MATINRMARRLLVHVGEVPEGVATFAKDQWEIGNQMGVLPESVTYHDSCNNARSCGMTEEPRELPNLLCGDFREMHPKRAENSCCTGFGGAMSMSEYSARRLKSAKIRADQLHATSGKIVVISCHNCVDGLFDLIRHYKLGMQVKPLVGPVAAAMVVPERVAEREKPGRAKWLEGCRILVVADEPDVRLYLSKIFQDQGCHVADAPDAHQAICAIESERPDLVTLNLVLPKETGKELYCDLRKDERFTQLPVLVVSGYAAIDQPKNDFHKFLADRGIPEPEGFLEKPVDPVKLIETVCAVLADKAAAKRQESTGG
jgi:CheY-like chemotaxis protein